MKKTIAAVLSGMMLSMAMVSSVFAGSWETDGQRYWYQTSQNSYYHSGVYTIDGALYGFDDAGYMLTGWQNPNNTDWYYFMPSGEAKTGWLESDGNLYYFNDNGVMKTNEFFTLTNSENQTYCYQAMADGHIRRNDSIDSDNKGNSWRFLSDGVIMYKSAISKAAGTDDGWRYYKGYTDEQANQVRDDKADKVRNETRRDDRAQKIMNEQKKDYAQIVKTTKKSQRSTKVSNWERYTREKLYECGYSVDEVNKYIVSVKTSVK